MRKESDILYQNGDFWICKDARKSARNGELFHVYEVYQNGATHATLAATIDGRLPNAFERAKSKCDERAKTEADKQAARNRR